ncbi:3-oxoacyl-[acyl-carrier-protein] synthase III C-terminal domain-containing protein [Haliovirga abyssi]|uniref:3-oxoacyl-[acyl-carrier-protein] synthase 3 protein 2 n=1 Tax=Haliovirga abyssi TaxID=2996794 RepID=A0AAU9DSI4_9FUSO|nr:3-oxoacyl-[acyl-carrier-protein] synthase III C-terminal domain-containing protein [Haliovirga abyssi]BDU51598.1 3-oxoacyl-[acyl-carrier-protein] synthase 3 protein 2 [Haliovirga abyssi]
MNGTKISGIGTYIHSVVSNNDYINIFGKKARFIDKKIPHKTRYSAINILDGSVEIRNSEMAYHASIEAMEMAKVKNDEIDMIIYSTSTPDYILPPNYVILQEKLGIKKCMGIDIRSGCSGFGNAIITAKQYIATGMAKKILVVGADLTSSRLSFLFKNLKEFPLKALYNLMLFGDAAGAVVVEKSEIDNFFGTIMGSSRPNSPFGSLIEVGGSVNPYPNGNFKNEDIPIHQNALATEQLIPGVMIEAVEEFLGKSNSKIEDFNYYILPIDSPRMASKVIEYFNLDSDKIISVGAEGGSLVNAAVPLALKKAYDLGKLKKGNKIMIYAAENTRWQYAVMGYNCNF